MNVAKLSASTRMALNNNFGFPKGENGTIGAFVKVSKNIDKELKDLGATIPSDFFGQARGELFGIRFPINSLDKISEIDGLVNLEIEQKLTMNPPRTNSQIDNDLNKQYQDAKNQQIRKYKVNKRTDILKVNPNKKDIFGDAGTDVIGTLEAGDVIEIAKTGGGGRGAVMTPYLIFSDDTYIIGYDADKVDDSTPLTSKLILETRLKPISFLQKNKTNLLIVGALVLGYLAYKKFNK
jgi:hypothetical protein